LNLSIARELFSTEQEVLEYYEETMVANQR